MSSETREEARTMATKMRREATLWEVGLEKSLHEMRSWSVLYAARRYHLDCATRRRSPRVRWYQKMLDEAHDMLLSAKDNVGQMARAIRASHMSARVYDESADNREWAEMREADYGDYGD